MCQLYNACHTSNKKCENGNIPPWNVKGYIKCNATYLLPISLLCSLLLSAKEPSAVTLYLSLMNGIMLNALLYRLERDDLWTLTLWNKHRISRWMESTTLSCPAGRKRCFCYFSAEGRGTCHCHCLPAINTNEALGPFTRSVIYSPTETNLKILLTTADHS